MWQKLSLRARLNALLALVMVLGLFINIARLLLEAGPRVAAEDQSVVRLARGFVETQATATLNGSCAWCKCRGATVPGSDSAAGSALPLGWQGV